MEEVEIWKDIEGYQGLYQVSNWGNVKSLDRYVRGNSNSKMFKKGTLLKFSSDKDGYLTVGLHKDKKHKLMKIHRLVALVFIPNPENLPCINHKNEIKTDNRVENLEWCTYQYNATYNEIHIKRGKKLKGRKFSEEHKKNMSKAQKGKPNYKCRKPILQFTKDMVFIREFDSATTASKELNINRSDITACCKGKHKTCGGFIWKYKENNTNLVIS